MAAVVAKGVNSPFCVAAHSATSTLWFGDATKVAATLADLNTAPIDEPLRATLHMLAKLSCGQAIDVDDMRGVLDAGVTRHRSKGALAVGLVFGITARLANAFDFDMATPAAMNAGAKHLLRRGYR